MFTHTLFGGQQKKWIIAFYGFGQSASVFNSLYENVKDEYNIIVIDNPMNDFQKEIFPKDLENYISGLLDEFKIKSFQSVSYSLGSRMNLYLPVLFSKQLEKMILIAPDGIEVQFWNRVAVNTSIGHSIFSFFVKKEGVYLAVLKFLYTIRLLNESLYAFSKWKMRDKNQRTKVYNAWRNMRKFIPDNKKGNIACEQNDIKVVSFFGDKDAVISKRYYNKCKSFFPKGEHHLIDSDHSILTKEFFTLLTKEIRK